MNEPINIPEPTTDDCNMALITHLLAIFTWVLGPLIFWLITKDKPEKAFVADQAKEAMNFQITMGLAMFVSMLLTIVLIGWLLMFVVGILVLVLSIVAAFKAREGIAYRYPFTLRLIK